MQHLLNVILNIKFAFFYFSSFLLNNSKNISPNKYLLHIELMKIILFKYKKNLVLVFFN